jgi:hypothetical protein
MTDAMQRLLGQADERPRSAEPPDGRSIDPQREAPGGGRTRSR